MMWKGMCSPWHQEHAVRLPHQQPEHMVLLLWRKYSKIGKNS